LGDSSSITVVDATGLILGRLASVVAKQLLTGERVVILNAEKALISGRRRGIIRAAKQRLERRTLGSKAKGPKHPRRPDGIVRRTVRGMLPRNKPRGHAAYKRLSVFIGVPVDYEDVTPRSLPEGRKSLTKTGAITVGEVAQSIGWKPVGERLHA
jgi:large subunit ribosomal protein L13